jgi:enhancing lycopene biosynthesis protein 2
MKIGLLLSGCGVYDGAEIQESVFSMLAIEELGASCLPISINKNQHHVINHVTGEEMNEERNMYVESARISRGNIHLIQDISPADIDALVIPGGFGSAKNFTSWAFLGSDSEILPEVKLLLVNLLNAGVPIVALCVSPVVLAKAFQDSSLNVSMTLGTEIESSPYSITDFHTGIKQVGAIPISKSVHEIQIDEHYKVITAPCYMMDASLLEIRENIKQAIFALKKWL